MIRIETKYKPYLASITAGLLCASAGVALAQPYAKIVPNVHGCRDAVIYNTTQHALRFTVDYLYKGANGSYYQSSSSCFYSPETATPPGSYCQTGLISGPVDCRQKYDVEILSIKWTDMTVIWAQEQQKERDNTMAIARMIDADNKRKSEQRARENEEKRRRHEAELARKREEQAKAMEQHMQDPMGLRKLTRGPIYPNQGVQATDSDAAVRAAAFQQQIRAEQDERDRQQHQSEQDELNRKYAEKQHAEALQLKQQAEAQARAAQAAAERQRQQAIAAQAAAAERARIEAEQKARIMAADQQRAQGYMQSTLASRQVAAESQQRRQQIASAQAQDNASLEQLLVQKKAERTAREQAAASANTSIVGCTDNLEAHEAEAQQVRRAKPATASIVDSSRTEMYLAHKGLGILDQHCPNDADAASDRERYNNKYQSAKTSCEAQAGKQPDSCSARLMW